MGLITERLSLDVIAMGLSFIRLSGFFSCLSSGRYDVAAHAARHAEAANQRERDDAERLSVVSTLQEALTHLRCVDTPAARRIRGRIAEALRHEDVRRISGEAPRLPSLARAQEWLMSARFDEQVRPGALRRLLVAVADEQAQWRALGIPSTLPLHRSLTQLAVDIGNAITLTNGRLGPKRLQDFDERRMDLRTRALDFVAKRGERIEARVRAGLASR